MALKSLGLALGSNLGNKIANLRAAVEGVVLLGEKSSLITSSIYETAPKDCPEGSEVFYNAVVQFRSKIDPFEVMAKCQQIEAKLGRPEEREVNAPRPIDIDLLYYGDHQISEENLQLPHPRIAERRFVLTPLAEIRPGLILPGMKQSIEEILEALDSDEPAPTQVFPGDSWL